MQGRLLYIQEIKASVLCIFTVVNSFYLAVLRKKQRASHHGEYGEGIANERELGMANWQLNMDVVVLRFTVNMAKPLANERETGSFSDSCPSRH
ncbi:MAG: hypothetical protein ACI90A_001257 [Shewanella sp.]|jgi:hypothetical protein